MSDNDALGSDGTLLLSHKSNMSLQGHDAELTKVKKTEHFFFCILNYVFAAHPVRTMFIAKLQK